MGYYFEQQRHNMKGSVIRKKCLLNPFNLLALIPYTYSHSLNIVSCSPFYRRPRLPIVLFEYICVRRYGGSEYPYSAVYSSSFVCCPLFPCSLRSSANRPFVVPIFYAKQQRRTTAVYHALEHASSMEHRGFEGMK